MKILKNNYNVVKALEEKEPDSIITCCDQCGSELEISPEDMYVGWLGAMHCICPCCGEETMVEQAKGITLTKDNVRFPQHYIRAATSVRNIVKLKDEEIDKKVRIGVEYLRQHKDEYYWSIRIMDTFIIVFNLSDDNTYNVVVSKDFYETDIPFTKEDY